MKKLIVICLVVIIVVFFAACSKSVDDKVIISDIEKNSFRPEGYVKTDDVDGWNWAGVDIEGKIKNISNETLRDIAVVIHFYGVDNKKSRKYETETMSLDPGETKSFKYKFVYDDQNVKRPFPWYHDIVGAIQK